MDGPLRFHIIGRGPIAKPPIGIRPKGIADQCRRIEIAEAIVRYVRAHKKIPCEWILELEDLNE